MRLTCLPVFLRDDRRNNESALKYFLLGSFATAFLLYGIAWTYGLVGSTNLDEIRHVLDQGLRPSLLVGLAMALLFVGFAFKVSVVPFQIWAPDVYQGAAAPVSAFMSAAPKAAAFAVFFRVFMTSFRPMHDRWVPLVWACALATMIVGNFAALLQTNVKRLLGYSSIAHAGYVMVALTASSQIGMAAAMFYLASYALMNIGAFMVISYVASRNERYVKIDDLAGLGRREPVIAALLAIFVFSLIGVPLTGGFFGKFYVFQAALNSHLVWLTVLGLINSAIAAYYYLKILVAVYMREPDVATTELPAPSASLQVAIWAAAVGTLILGIFPSTLLSFASSSAVDVSMNGRSLEKSFQLAHSLDAQQARMTFRDLFPFESPGSRMRHVNGAQADRKCRIDIGLRRVSNHPGSLVTKAAFLRKFAICQLVFLLHDRRVLKVAGQPRSINLDSLLVGIAFCKNGELVP